MKTLLNALENGNVTERGDHDVTVGSPGEIRTLVSGSRAIIPMANDLVEAAIFFVEADLMLTITSFLIMQLGTSRIIVSHNNIRRQLRTSGFSRLG